VTATGISVTDNGNNRHPHQRGRHAGRHLVRHQRNGGPGGAVDAFGGGGNFSLTNCNIMNNANVGVIGNGVSATMNNCYLYQNAGRPGFDTNTMPPMSASTDSQYQGMTSVLAPRRRRTSAAGGHP